MPVNIIITVRDYRGRSYADFHARRDHGSAPGWFVFGRNHEWYGGHLVTVCARPDNKPRHRPNWNGKLAAGWRTKREAQAVADMLNRRDDCKALVDYSCPPWV